METIKKIWECRVCRFLLVGALNTSFSYSIYSIFLYLDFYFIIASLISLTSGIIFSFITSSKLIFRVKGHFLKYLLFWIVLYGFNIFTISLFIGYGFNAYQAGFIALPIITAISYILQKWVVFRQSTS